MFSHNIKLAVTNHDVYLFVISQPLVRCAQINGDIGLIDI